jgi:2,5-diketo-D-gluconate reductase A
MKIPQHTLNDKTLIPQLGYGLWQVPDEDAEKCCLEALRLGYRSIDSAQIYQNEAGLGRAIRRSEIPRHELFITTKVWNSEHGYDSTLKSFDESLKKLQLETLDLFLIHWPAPHKNAYLETWNALIELKKQGRVKAIGVSNFHQPHLEKIIGETGVVPAINQIELHPKFQQTELRSFHQKHGIQTECWSPLGQGQLLSDPTLHKLAQKHHKSVAQIIIRWHLEQSLIVIPKTVTPARMKENLDVFDFKLSTDDLATIARLDDKDGRIGPNPETATF